MRSLFDKYLIFKLLVVLIIVLALSFSGLSFFIMKKQKSLLSEIGTQVNNVLSETGNKAEQSFNALSSHVKELLLAMQEETTQTIATTTSTALDGEEKKIQAAMESLLLKNSEGISAILNSVAPGIISRKSFGDLINYSKAASETNEIIYILFFDEKGEPLPSHLNPKDPKIKQYMIQGSKDSAPIQRAIEESKKDDSVMVFEHPIKYYGSVLGKTVICLNRDSVISEITALGGRFKTLRDTNSLQIETTLDTKSGQVLDNIEKDLKTVNQASRQVTGQTQTILKQAAAKGTDSIRLMIILMGLICTIITLGLLGVCLHYIVIIPLKNVSDGLADTAQGEGDLTRRLDLARKDEIGILAGWFDTFIGKLNRIIGGVSTDVLTVRDASEEVLSDASSINEGVSSLHERAAAVAAAAEEMSASMDSVAAASEQASTNVTQVSEAAGQMRASLNEVSVSCDRARAIAGNASNGAKNASSKVGDLGQAAREISKVTEVITDIAEQTNLLALNATIEAARAGTAGRGFTVVASEIKGLAAQTADATGDIRTRIQAIQSSTEETVSEVGRISEVIAEVNEIVSSIAAAVEQQSEAASNVAESISQAAAGIHEVNINVSESSQVSTEIARDISGVNTVADTISQGSVRMTQRAQELSSLASRLKETIGVFKIS